MFNYRAESPVDADRVRQMCDSMVHRGPDDQGLWTDEKRQVTLGQRRLAIIDLSPLGHQPMHWADGRYTITFNGEIYNYQELREQLLSQGRQFRSHSDTEVLLALYERDGEEMCSLLRGMYAFVIYDKVEEKVFIARDPYGIKPFYYADCGGVFTFASTVKGVERSMKFDDSLDPAAVVSFFVWGYVATPHTLRKGIRELPAGHRMVVSKEGIGTPRQFYSLSETMARAAETSIRPEAMREALVEAVRDSIRHHLISDVPVGLFLSAGVDSTSLLSAMHGLGYPSTTLTLGFQEYRGTGLDEVGIAEQVAKQLDASHQTIWIEGKEFGSDLEDIVEKMDQPSVDGVNTYLVSKYARQAGFTVAVSGLGGDELLGGYVSFTQIPEIVKRTRWAAGMPWLGRGLRKLASPIVSRFTSPKMAGVFEYGGSVPGAYLLRRSHFLPHELFKFLDPEIVTKGWEELQTLQKLQDSARGGASTYEKVALLEAQWYMRNQLLRDSDWAGMAHSIELRVPLVDIKLFEAMAPFIVRGVAPHKDDLAACLHPSVRDTIVNRPKSGFSVPVRQWLMEEDASNSERSVRGFAKMIGRRFGIPVSTGPGGRPAVGPMADNRSGTF
ncbi:MAG: asparagine synthase (glutamine-hydrolyzing) [Fimbriimonadaceae bacterium]|nr:asparagine synthase (glutamine-hydrolyzing) [Fimbriimonadaceae bacterium]